MPVRRACRRALAVGLLALVAGCSGTPEKTRPKVLPDIAAPVPVKELWRTGVAAGEHYVFQPAVRGKSVFAAGADGQVVRVDDGREVWSVTAAKSLSGGVSVNERLLVAGSLKGEVLALDPENGRLVWKNQLSAEVVAPAAFADDVVVVRTADNRLYGLDARDGQRRWVYQRTIPPLSIRVTTAPLVADRIAFAGFPGGRLVAVNVQNGQAVWEGTVAQPKGTTELERMADVVAAPAMGAKEICAVAHQGRLSCFDLVSGNLLWARDVSATAALAIDHQAVYVADDQGVVQAFDRVSGGTVWKQDKLENRRLTGPLLLPGLVVTADDQGLLHALDRETGAFRGRLALDAGRVESELRAFDGGLVMLTRQGLLVALRIDR